MSPKRTLIFILGAWLLTSCAPAAQTSDDGNTSVNTTGFKNEKGIDYVHGGDGRVDDSLSQPDPEPAPGKSPIKPKPADTNRPANVPTERPDLLRERLKEFEMSRFAAQYSTNPSRFGAHHFTLTMDMHEPTSGKKTVKFSGNFGGDKSKLTVNSTSGDYVLTGHLIDEIPNQSQGEFTLTELSTKEVAVIFYWAYKGKITVREDRTRKVIQGSAFERQLKNLRENTFSWVNNWSAKRGRAFYVVDIVSVSTPDKDGAKPLPKPILAFKGESLRTGDENFTADPVTTDTKTEVELTGNAEEGVGRAFAVKLEDPESKETNEIMIDVELDDAVTPPQAKNVPLPEARPPQDDDGVELPDEHTPPPARPEGHGEKPIVTKPAAPAKPVAPAKPAEKPVAPARAGKAFLRVDKTRPRTRAMEADFQSAGNRNLKGVKDWIAKYQGKTWSPALTKFYRFANPYRTMMEAVGHFFDVSPAYAYLTVIESAYFTGGKYKIQKAPNSSALGPFQLLDDTAVEVKLKIGGGSADERRFFAPSACGAARYIRKLVDTFDDSDRTISILGYFQGDGGGAAAIYCSFGDVKDRKTCAERIGNQCGKYKTAKEREACRKRTGGPFKSKDYGRFLKLAKNYNYTYAQMARLAAIPSDMRDYVNKKLAVYFISNDMAAYGFSVPSDAPRKYPGNGTVTPSKISDAQCREVIGSVL